MNKIMMHISKNILKYLIAIVIASSILAPYLVIIDNSFKKLPVQYYYTIDKKDDYRQRYRNFTINGYRDVFRNDKTRLYFFNSLIVSGGTTLLSIAISVLVAYALSRINFRWKKRFELTVYATQMFPSIAFVVPYFVIFLMIKRFTGIPMRNTYHGLIITYCSFALPFCILMLKNYFSNIPKYLDEQAQIDGCSRLQAITRIIIPTALPGIISVAIYSFVMSWNEILFAFTLTGPEKRTMAIGLFNGVTFSSYSEYFATCLLITLPLIIVFALLQKQLVRGLGRGLIN